ncbi:hypothetical protein ATANTOWER_031592 [Ataeniobius toweri]|uniref:Secreted protein n=1 Tax=Ataeniobius toweri TaxID=208326 RepID=A0ABU7AU36_9TELE|nr:hypothetical protein [Ataeniobius toweri]
MVGRLILCYIVDCGLRAATPPSYRPPWPLGFVVADCPGIQNGRKRRNAWWRPATCKWSNIQQNMVQQHIELVTVKAQSVAMSRREKGLNTERHGHVDHR